MAGPDDLDLPCRGRHDGAVHRVDLHAMGASLGRDTLCGHADRLVLAEERRGGCRNRGARTTVSERAAIDVSRLPNYAFGHRSVLWWGTLGFIITEGTAFALAVTAYFYL